MPEGPSNSVVNVDFGDLSKPADTLVKKVSKAVSGIFRPYQIVRIAKAEAEAAIIQAQNQIQVTDLHRRAMHRFIEEEAQRQQNIETITGKALPQLTEGAKPDSMEDDWVSNFFDKCRIVSDTQMQGLWSRVLAGEANVPGTFSKRTVNFLSDLDKTDAEMFAKLCGFGWDIKGFAPLILNTEWNIYAQNGVGFSSLNHLESIGLIRLQSSPLEKNVEFGRTNLPRDMVVHYYGRSLHLTLGKKDGNLLGIGVVLLTKTGIELAPICGSQPVEGFWEHMHLHWKSYLRSKPCTSAVQS
jgi:hypothetical protein